MDKKCLIISGGDYCELNSSLSNVDLIIACDKGLTYAKSYGLVPDVIIGDFDSCERPSFSEVTRTVASENESASLSGISDKKPVVITYPVKKDDTDTMLAIKYALSHDYRDITIVCAFGGRLDHAFANIQSGSYIAENGGKAKLVGNDTVAFIEGPGSIEVPKLGGFSLSVFSLSDSCKEVSITNAKYEVENISVSSHFPVGVSNVWLNNDKAIVSHKSGTLMVMCSKLKPHEHI